MKTPYTRFDSSTRYLLDGAHYVPARARSGPEEDRRRNNPAGTTLLEQQERGLLIAGKVFRSLEHEDDVEYAAGITAGCGLVVKRYLSGGRSAGVMNRHDMLPYFARREGQDRPTTAEELLKVQAKIDRAAAIAGGLVTLKANRKPGQSQQASLLGRAVTGVSLHIVSAPMADELSQSSPFAVQNAIRERCMEADEDARSLGLQIGTPPSFAQLADPHSDLAVHIFREAPTAVVGAYQDALDQFAMPV